MQIANQNIISSESISSSVINEYLEFKEGRTKIEYKRNLNRFFNWLNSKGHEKINPITLNSYKMHLESSGLKINSVNAYLSAVKDFCKWCAEMNYLPNDPGKYLRRVKHRDISKVSKARSLSAKEVQALLSATSKDTIKDFSERIYLLLIFNLGLRVHEAMNAKFEDIDFDARTIDIIGKGSKLRVLGTNEVLIKELKEYADYTGRRSGHIVSNVKTKGKVACTRQHGNRVLKRIAKRAGIDMTDIKSHSGRVTAINFLLDNDVSLRDVANFAGHSDISTTRTYDRKDQDKIIQTCNIIDFTKDQ